jgi:hypothetical protein
LPTTAVFIKILSSLAREKSIIPSNVSTVLVFVSMVNMLSWSLMAGVALDSEVVDNDSVA